MVILTKFVDFVMFGTRDLEHNGEKFKKCYHLHKPSHMPYLTCRKQFVKTSIQFCPFHCANFDPSWACLFIDLIRKLPRSFQNTFKNSTKRPSLPELYHFSFSFWCREGFSMSYTSFSVIRHDATKYRYACIIHIDLRNEFISLFVDGSIHPKKKMTGNCIIARSA
jgi:hypothetical protein